MMKRRFLIGLKTGFLALFAAFFLAACESPTAAIEDETEDTQELSVLATTLSQELSLDADQQAVLRSVMDRHVNRMQDPGVLWYIARDLQATLTDEQKQHLFDLTASYEGQGGFPGQGFRGPGGHGWGGQAGFGGFGDPRGGALFDDLLTEEQKAAVEAIRETYRTQIEALVEARRDGTVTDEEFRAQMPALQEAMKTEIEALLTDEQKAEIERRIEERRTERETYREANQAQMLERRTQERAAMVDALGLDADQKAALEALWAEHDAAIETVRNQFEAGTLAPEEAFRASLALRESLHIGLMALLNETQGEIVLIHKALALRHRAAGQGQDGFGHRGTGQGGPGQGGPGQGGPGHHNGNNGNNGNTGGGNGNGGRNG